MSKLNDLMSIEGITMEDIGHAAVFDGIVYGICMNPDCDYTSRIEPDAAKEYGTGGWCEHCNAQTVTSGAVLMGII